MRSTHFPILKDVGIMTIRGIDLVHQIAHLGGNIDQLAVLADRHALGLGAGWHLLDDDVLVHVDHGQRRRFLVRHVNPALGFVDRECLGAGAGRKLADHRKLRDIDDLDDVVVAASDVKLLMSSIEMHVARPPRRLDVLDDLIGLGIQHDDVVRFLVADENEPGILCGAWRRQNDG